jgi:hypothetical protein
MKQNINNFYRNDYILLSNLPVLYREFTVVYGLERLVMLNYGVSNNYNNFLKFKDSYSSISVFFLDLIFLSIL